MFPLKEQDIGSKITEIYLEQPTLSTWTNELGLRIRHLKEEQLRINLDTFSCIIPLYEFNSG